MILNVGQNNNNNVRPVNVGYRKQVMMLEWMNLPKYLMCIHPKLQSFNLINVYSFLFMAQLMQVPNGGTQPVTAQLTSLFDFHSYFGCWYLADNLRKREGTLYKNSGNGSYHFHSHSIRQDTISSTTQTANKAGKHSLPPVPQEGEELGIIIQTASN